MSWTWSATLQKCTLRHEQNLSCFSLLKSEPAWLYNEELKFGWGGGGEGGGRKQQKQKQTNKKTKKEEEEEMLLSHK